MELPIVKQVVCPKDDSYQDPDFCPGCEHYKGDRFDRVICKHGEYFSDIIADYAPLNNFSKLEYGDGIILLNSSNTILLKIDKKDLEKVQDLINSDIPEVEEKFINPIINKFHTEFDEDDLFEVKPLKIGYDEFKLFEVNNSVMAFNYKYSWIFRLLEEGYKAMTRSQNMEVKLIKDGELFGMVMPVRLGGINIDNKESVIGFLEDTISRLKG